MKRVEVHYSFREYRTVELTLPNDADVDDEDVIREALRAEDMTFSEDEEFALEGAYDMDEVD